MVLAEEFVARVFRDAAEIVVDVGDAPALIGHGNDARLIDRIFEIAQLARRGLRFTLGERAQTRRIRQLIASHDHAGGDDTDSDNRNDDERDRQGQRLTE